MTPTEQIERLRELERKATAGPWYAHNTDDEVQGGEKMTKAQEKFLRECAEKARSAVDDYRPAEALWLCGLIERHHGWTGNHTYTITDAGRAALAALDAKRGGE